MRCKGVPFFIESHCVLHSGTSFLAGIGSQAQRLSENVQKVPGGPREEFL